MWSSSRPTEASAGSTGLMMFPCCWWTASCMPAVKRRFCFAPVGKLPTDWSTDARLFRPTAPAGLTRQRPGVEDGDAGIGEVGHIAGHDDFVVHPCGRGNQRV